MKREIFFFFFFFFLNQNESSISCSADLPPYRPLFHSLQCAEAEAPTGISQFGLVVDRTCSN